MGSMTLVPSYEPPQIFVQIPETCAFVTEITPHFTWIEPVHDLGQW